MAAMATAAAAAAAGPDGATNRSRGASTSHGMFSRLNLTVECPTEFGQTVHVSGSSFLAGVSNPALVSDAPCHLISDECGPFLMIVPYKFVQQGFRVRQTAQKLSEFLAIPRVGMVAR